MNKPETMSNKIEIRYSIQLEATVNDSQVSRQILTYCTYPFFFFPFFAGVKMSMPLIIHVIHPFTDECNTE